MPRAHTRRALYASSSRLRPAAPRTPSRACSRSRSQSASDSPSSSMRVRAEVRSSARDRRKGAARWPRAADRASRARDQSVDLRTLPYDALRDFAPITQGISQANLFVVHPSLPAKSARELIALAKARPGDSSTLRRASAQLAPHGGAFLLMSGTRMLHVPYKGPGPGVIDLIAGRVALMAASTISSITHVQGRAAACDRRVDGDARDRPSGHSDDRRIRRAGIRVGVVVRPRGACSDTEGNDRPVAPGERLHLRTPRQQYRNSSPKTVRSSSPAPPRSSHVHIRSETVKWARVSRAPASRLNSPARFNLTSRLCTIQENLMIHVIAIITAKPGMRETYWKRLEPTLPPFAPRMAASNTASPSTPKGSAASRRSSAPTHSSSSKSGATRRRSRPRGRAAHGRLCRARSRT